MSEERWKIDDGSQWSGDPEDPPVQSYEASVYDGTGWCLVVAGAPEGCSSLDEMEMLRTVAAALNAAERSDAERKLLEHLKEAIGCLALVKSDCTLYGQTAIDQTIKRIRAALPEYAALQTEGKDG